MYFKIILAVVFMLGCSDVKGYESCEYELLRKCGEDFVAGFEAKSNPDMQAYCNGFQV